MLIMNRTATNALVMMTRHVPAPLKVPCDMLEDTSIVVEILGAHTLD